MLRCPALRGWEWTSRTLLQLEPKPLPWIVVFDGRCRWHVNADPTHTSFAAPRHATDERFTYAGTPLRGIALPHSGQVRLPNDAQVPARIVAFAAPRGHGEKTFLVIALPSVWRRDPDHAANPELDALTLGVFMHEAAHTRQVIAADR